jgi:AcrR family transcriptional regulator
VTPTYQPPRRIAFGNASLAKGTPATQRRKPLKRPSQDRAKFTVQTIFDGFVRIWRRQGWAAVTTRNISLETGYAVGTLYEYFPNREALLSGYVRYAIEALLARITADAGPARALSSRERVSILVRLTCGAGVPDLPLLDSDMLALEHRIAEPKHHRRVYEELCAVWTEVLGACDGSWPTPDPSRIEAMVAAVWGARRYLLLVKPRGFDQVKWAEQMEQIVWAALGGAAPVHTHAERPMRRLSSKTNRGRRPRFAPT